MNRTYMIDACSIGAYYASRLGHNNPVNILIAKDWGIQATAAEQKKRCLMCGEEHQKKIFCHAKIEFCILCCSNCGGTHRANSRICPLIAEAYEIEKHTAYNQ